MIVIRIPFGTGSYCTGGSTPLPSAIRRFRQSRQRLASRYGLYRGVMVDLFYDHFLALEWEAWSDEPLDVWLARVRGIVESHRSSLPERLQGLVPTIFGELLPSYREVVGIGRALERSHIG